MLLLDVFCLMQWAALGRSLPVMIAEGAGQIQRR
jgi:hypothetical protein